ncbi:hypothetical protein HG66A1_16050 [Gimesia chilikensis]|uniref:Uncharacterized protein n=1 Tax=Gimesia chilikensis TaxID=2605989 RepID=A0A517PKD4_9PLAN|nr:hypothetical protein HG66A1_16050 [Gimesia chilikensis]
MLPTNLLSAPLSRLRRRIPNQRRITRTFCMQQMRLTLSATVSTLMFSGRTYIYPTGCADDAPPLRVSSLHTQQNRMVHSRYGTFCVILSSKSTNFRGNLNDVERLCPDRNELKATNLSIGALTETRDDLTISVGVKVHSTGASVALSAGDDCLKLFNPLSVNVTESRLEQSFKRDSIQKVRGEYVSPKRDNSFDQIGDPFRMKSDKGSFSPPGEAIKPKEIIPPTEISSFHEAPRIT